MSSEASANDGSSPGLLRAAPDGAGTMRSRSLVWTAAIVAFFWDAVSLRGALFYFDITEINYPYRAFFAESCEPGGFRDGAPGFIAGCRFTAKARRVICIRSNICFIPGCRPGRRSTFDTVLSIWLTGVGSYLLAAAARRADSGAFGRGHLRAERLHLGAPRSHQHDQRACKRAVRDLGLEYSWSSGRWRGVVMGACAMAFQTFAGHLQDVILTAGLVGLYGLYRAATESGLGASRARTRRWRSRSPGWASCSRPCNGFRQKSCSIDRRAAAALPGQI